MIFSTEEINNLIEQKKETLKINETIQNTLKKQIVKNMQDLSNSNIQSPELSTYFVDLLDVLKKALEISNTNIARLEELATLTNNLFLSKDTSNFDEVLKNYSLRETSINLEIHQNMLLIDECLENISILHTDDLFNIMPEESEVISDNKTKIDYVNQQIIEEKIQQTIPETQSAIEKTEQPIISEIEPIIEETVQPDVSEFQPIIEETVQPVVPESQPIIEETKQPVISEIEPIVEESEQPVIPEIQTITEEKEQNYSEKTSSDSSVNESNSTCKSEIKDTQSKIKENTLIISELSQKVVLPYSSNELNTTLKQNTNKYSSIEDIINEKYTVPISMYKNPLIARFKEAYKLMRKKEKSPIPDAINLATELMFNHKLHPAIISACKNLDELDIYLDYLENGDVQKFAGFKVIFELYPTKAKQKSIDF